MYVANELVERFKNGDEVVRPYQACLVHAAS